MSEVDDLRKKVAMAAFEKGDYATFVALLNEAEIKAQIVIVQDEMQKRGLSIPPRGEIKRGES